jgi:integrase
MPKPATGTVEYRPGKAGTSGSWWGRITCSDGSRPWLELGDWPNSEQGKARAREAVAHHSERARALGIVAAPQRGSKAHAARLASSTTAEGETVAEYAARWLADRERRGLASVGTDRSRLKAHVYPLLEERAMRSLTREDVERVVERLDAEVIAGKLSWKTAGNVWALLAKMFDDARNAKTSALRVLDSNPAADVRGPDRGARKSRAYLYPSEFLAFVNEPAVPLAWRRLLALAVYTYTRAGELAALEWSDVDFEHAILHVHRALDRTKPGRTKATKTGVARRIPIEPALLPLMKAMHEESGGTGRLLPGLPDIDNLSASLRRYLRRAGLTRPELLEGDATRKAITFHDLRATGCTWMAVRGDEPLRIMQRAGHTDFKTTQLYVREAENLRTAIGAPFPPLPASIVRPVVGSDEDEEREGIVRGIVLSGRKRSKTSEKLVRRGGLEPPWE